MEPTSSGQARRRQLRKNNLQEFRESGSDVPVETAASARSTEVLRCLNEASAFSTLIRQRPPTPSCGGQSPYRGENSGPGRYNMESLTSNPRVREQPRLQLDIQQSQSTLRRKLVKIGAKIARHGRYITSQMAEVAMPRDLFWEILRMIDGLRPKPAPTSTGAHESRTAFERSPTFP